MSFPILGTPEPTPGQLGGKMSPIHTTTTTTTNTTTVICRFTEIIIFTCNSHQSVAILAQDPIRGLVARSPKGPSMQQTLVRWGCGRGPGVVVVQPTPYRCGGCQKGFTKSCYLSNHQRFCAPWRALDDRRKRMRPALAPVEVPAEVPVVAPAEAPVEMPAEALAEAPMEAPAEAPVEAPAEASYSADEDLHEPDVRNVPSLQEVARLLSRYAGLKAANPRLSQEAAAKTLGISQSMLSRYLKKQHKIGDDGLGKRRHVRRKSTYSWKRRSPSGGAPYLPQVEATLRSAQ